MLLHGLFKLGLFIPGERKYLFSLALLDKFSGPGCRIKTYNLIVNANGAESSYSVGNKGYARSGIVSYQIVRVWIGPDGRSLVIAVAKEDADLSIRYMVETLVIN